MLDVTRYVTEYFKIGHLQSWVQFVKNGLDVVYIQMFTPKHEIHIWILYSILQNAAKNLSNTDDKTDIYTVDVHTIP